MLMVYMLYDNKLDVPFYVGVTSKNLDVRLKSHISEAKSQSHYKKFISGKRYERINKMINEKNKPEIVLLNFAFMWDVNKVEKYYYDLFTSNGIDLLQSKYNFHYNKSMALKSV